MHLLLDRNHDNMPTSLAVIFLHTPPAQILETIQNTFTPHSYKVTFIKVFLLHSNKVESHIKPPQYLATPHQSPTDSQNNIPLISTTQLTSRSIFLQEIQPLFLTTLLKGRGIAFNGFSATISSADFQNRTKTQACAVTPTDNNASLLPDKIFTY